MACVERPASRWIGPRATRPDLPAVEYLTLTLELPTSSNTHRGVTHDTRILVLHAALPSPHPEAGARRIRSRAFRRRATFEAVEDRLLLSTVNFSTAGESVNGSAGSFTIPVTLSGGTPTISPFASGINEPAGMAFGPDGDLYVADGEDHTVDKVTPAGQVTTFASGFPGSDVFATPSDLAFNSKGDLFVADSVETTLSEVSPSGQVTTFASGFDEPDSLVFDSAGNLYVANAGKNTVSKVTPAGKVTTFATGLNAPNAMAIDSAGNLFVSSGEVDTVYKITPAGIVSTFASGIGFADALAVDAAGNLYVADADNTVSEVTPAGSVSSFASGLERSRRPGVRLRRQPLRRRRRRQHGGQGQPGRGRAVHARRDRGLGRGLQRRHGQPADVRDRADHRGHHRHAPLRPRPHPDADIHPGHAHGGATLGSPSTNTLTITEPASVQFSHRQRDRERGPGTFSIPVTLSGTPDGTPTVSAFASGFNSPVGLAVDAAGNLYVADTGDNTVDKVTPGGHGQHLCLWVQ